jgi:hypothetical protein
MEREGDHVKRGGSKGLKWEKTEKNVDRESEKIQIQIKSEKEDEIEVQQ